MLELLPVLIWVVLGALGWFVRGLVSDVRATDEALSKLREELPVNFVMKDDYRRDIHDIKDTLKEIRQALEKRGSD